MSGLRNDLQIVLQTSKSFGGVLCEGFTGLPIVRPGYIAVAPTSSAAAASDADQLANDLRRQILTLPGARSAPRMPCAGMISGFGCHAYHVPECIKLMVVVGDLSTPISPSHPAAHWLSQGPGFEVLPAFPQGANPSALLPGSLRKIQSAHWINSASEVVPDIFSRIGLVPSDFRIFVSYRVKEALQISEQLFNALAQTNFDVFVDRFRLKPAVDFHRRLRQELAHKSMVLVLESAGILSSPWTRFEVQFAKTERLGLLALHLPGGVKVPDIADSRRIFLRNTDLQTSGELTDAAVEKVVQRVKQEHSRALLRRRKSLRDAMLLALLRAGAPPPRLGSDGILSVKPQGMSPRQYALWLTTRPAELEDFHLLASHSQVGTVTKVLVSPAAYLHGASRARMGWLAGVSGVEAIDEGKMLQAAKAMAKGRL